MENATSRNTSMMANLVEQKNLQIYLKIKIVSPLSPNSF
jgi:hypothetical protein